MCSRCSHVKVLSSTIIWLVLFLVLSLAVAGPANEPGHYVVVPVEETGTPPQVHLPGPDAVGRWANRRLEAPKLIVPMPVPKRRDSASRIEGANRQVTFNLKTREEAVLSERSNSVVGSTQAGRRQVLDGTPSSEARDGWGPKNFSDPERVSDSADHPWCVNCKLFISFTDETGMYTNWFVASGTLIDAAHVLTAGHNLYAHEIVIDNMVYSINDWADEVIVVPAYEDEISPYGSAAAASMFSWFGWTVAEDSDYDIGVIRLDRPVGAITGWYDYGSQTDPLFYLENVFNSVSYPQGWPYDGERMYYWYGPFDDVDYDWFAGAWYGNTASIDRPAYGGQSGSGVYTRSGEQRTVYGVFSHMLFGRAHFTLLTQSMCDAIGDFISENTPSVPDLVPLFTKIETPTVHAGGYVTDMSHVLYNNSSAYWSGRVLLAAYLSNDRIVSSADTHLGQFYIDLVLAPQSDITLSFPPVWVPGSVPKGSYWLGVYLLSDDSDGTNNSTSVQDVAPIVVGFDKLTDDTPETYVNGPRDFAYDVVADDWCCVGISPTLDYDLRVYSNPNFMGSYASSLYYGTARDFIVVNGHQWGDATHYARVGQMVGGRYTVEATWRAEDLTPGVGRFDTMDSDEVHEIYEAYLVAGVHYQLGLDVLSGAADLSVYVFKPSQNAGSRSNYSWRADQYGPWYGEYLSFTPTSTGYHAIVVINENAKSAEYSLIVQP